MAWSNTGKPMTRTALAPAAVVEWPTPRRKVTVSAGVCTRAAARAAGESASISTQLTAPATVAHRYPPSPQPIAKLAAATVTLSSASVTIRAPYPDHWLRPASMPSSVVCTQKPASPRLSSAMLSARSSTNTWADHSGEVSAISAAAPTPTPAPMRIGRLRPGSPRAERTSRVLSCSRPNAAPLASPKAPQNTLNTEKPAGSRSRAARYSTAYPHSADTAVAAPTRTTLLRVTAPEGLAAASVTAGPAREPPRNTATPPTTGAASPRCTARPAR